MSFPLSSRPSWLAWMAPWSCSLAPLSLLAWSRYQWPEKVTQQDWPCCWLVIAHWTGTHCWWAICLQGSKSHSPTPLDNDLILSTLLHSSSTLTGFLLKEKEKGTDFLKLSPWNLYTCVCTHPLFYFCLESNTPNFYLLKILDLLLFFYLLLMYYLSLFCRIPISKQLSTS